MIDLEDALDLVRSRASSRKFPPLITARGRPVPGKTILLGISKRGNTYLRRLLIHGARSCVQTCDRQCHPLGAWITKLEQRIHRNKVIVALANKIARVAWKILIKPEEIYRWVDA
jgi:transposase